MFVRYRKLVFDGHPPAGVQASLACAGHCQRRHDRHCPVKPRCRWRIGSTLVPYRLQVALLENHRDGGRVQQQHIATLGAVDAWLLPEFWASIDAVNTKTMKAENWDALSVAARMAFWEMANPRLKRLVNRLDPKAVRMEIHRRIPWPMQTERDLAEARSDFRQWKGLDDLWKSQIERNEKLIASLQAQVAEAHEKRRKNTPGMMAAVNRLAKLQGS